MIRRVYVSPAPPQWRIAFNDGAILPGLGIGFVGDARPNDVRRNKTRVTIDHEVGRLYLRLVVPATRHFFLLACGLTPRVAILHSSLAIAAFSAKKQSVRLPCQRRGSRRIETCLRGLQNLVVRHKNQLHARLLPGCWTRCRRRSQFRR